MAMEDIIGDLKFDEEGLIPAIVQDAQNGQVLMFAYANEEALQKTIKTKRAHFWSRSRSKLWKKGEESGNIQEVKDIYFDCDRDSILITVKQKGVACHTGNRTCFFSNIDMSKNGSPTYTDIKNKKTLDDVFEVIDDRKRNPKENSYVSSLFEKGLDGILKKIGEEAGETIIGAKNKDKDEIIYEATDLFFHTLILLSYYGIEPSDIYREFDRRFGKSKEEYGNKK